MQKIHENRIVLRLVAVLALLGVLVMAGCPEEDDDNDGRVEVNETITLGAGNAALGRAAVGGRSFTYNNGIPALQTTTSTTVAFNAAANRATISQGTLRAGSDFAFTASCTFTNPAAVAGNPPFPAGSPLAPGGTGAVISPCRIQIVVDGQVLPEDDVDTGTRTTATLILIFGTTSSAEVQIPIIVRSSDNQLYVVNSAGEIVATGIIVTGTGSGGGS